VSARPVHNFVDLTGRRFGRLVVQERIGKHLRSPLWRCLCDCGKEHAVISRYLVHEATKSCGCLAKETIINRTGDHSFRFAGSLPKWKHPSHSREYSSWKAMKSRCENPNDQAFSRYGGRGIVVCERWSKSFDAFVEDMGLRPEGTTIDRFPDPNGNYEPGNCRWATLEEQNANRPNIPADPVVTHDGLTLTLSEWSARNQISRDTIRTRINQLGWTPERAVSVPAQRRSK